MDGAAVESGHQSAGLFLRLDYQDDRVDLVQLQASAGDATGDGRFDSTDLIQVFRLGQYEDGIDDNSDWTSGDWDGDQEFSTSDLVWAFRNSPYLIDSAVALTVPEAKTPFLFIPLLVCLFAGIRRRR